MSDSGGDIPIVDSSNNVKDVTDQPLVDSSNNIKDYRDPTIKDGDDSDSDREKNSVHSSDEEDNVDELDGASAFELEAVRKESRKRSKDKKKFFKICKISAYSFLSSFLNSSSRDYLASKLGISDLKFDNDEQTLPVVLSSLDIDGVAEFIKEGKAKNIIVMAGAGISTSAGIPDFRSPGTGLYDNLQKYNLPYPTAVFDIRYFEENPKPFYTLAKELYPGSFKPTPSHYFVKMLEEKGLLLRHFTQNIDTLERVAGISDEKIVEAHGAFHTGHCIKPRCRKEYSQEWIKDLIFKDEIPQCILPDCGGFVKPDIVFFGENLPEKFFKCMQSDFGKCDLLIIMGTSLTVQPFASLIDRVGKNVPRVLINMDKVGVASDLMSIIGGTGMMFDSPKNYRDVAILGPCDDGCFSLAEKLGWKQDLENLVSK